MWRGRAGALRILPTYLTKKNRRARRAPTADVHRGAKGARQPRVRLAYIYFMESDIRANMGTHHHTITPSHHTHEDAARDVRVCGLADRDERILYTTATHTCVASCCC